MAKEFLDDSMQEPVPVSEEYRELMRGLITDFIRGSRQRRDGMFPEAPHLITVEEEVTMSIAILEKGWNEQGDTKK